MNFFNPLIFILRKYWSNYQGFNRSEWILFIANMINSIGVMCSIYVALYLKLDLHFTINQVGAVITCAGIGYLLGGTTGGAISDKVSARDVIIFSLCSSAVTLFMLALIHSFHSFALINLISGFCIGLFRPASTLFMLSFCEPEFKTRAVGLRRMAVNLGFALAGFFGGLLIHFGYKSIFYFDSVMTFAAMLCILFFCKAQEHLTTHKQEFFYTDWDAKKTSWAYFKDSYFLWVCCFTLLPSLIFFQIRTTYPIFLHDYYHIGPHGLGYLTGINGLIIFFLEIPILNKLRQYNQEWAASVGVLLLCSGFFILMLGHSTVLAFLSCIFYTFGEILLYPTALVLALNRATKENEGKYMSVYQLTFALPQIFAPEMGSLIYSHLGPNYLWSLAGLIGIVGFLGFIFLGNEVNKSKQLVTI